MRVLVLSNFYPPHHLGGYELACQGVVDRFRARGHTVGVLTTTERNDGVDDPPGERGELIFRDLRFYWKDHVLQNPRLPRRIAVERSNQAALERALETIRPDVVSVWHMGAMSLGLLATVAERGIPMVFVVFDDWLIYGTNLDAWSRLFRTRPGLERVVRRMTKLPSAPRDLGRTGPFLFISDFTRRRAEEGSRWHPERSAVVYCGIDPEDFPSVAPVAKPWRWRLLYAGRLDERKGVHVAVDALAALPGGATLEIDGRGEAAYEASLQEQARRLGVSDRVRFAASSRDELRARYAAADAVVFPVLWDEPFGLVPIEAMACGTPVVATGTGGSAEFLRDGENCLLVPRGDAKALAAAVERLASDAALRERIVDGGLRTASEFTVDRLTDRLEAWHQAAVDRFAHGVPTDHGAAI